MESMDQENLPPAKKELLRQMSTPGKPNEDGRSALNRKVQPDKRQKADFYFAFGYGLWMLWIQLQLCALVQIYGKNSLESFLVFILKTPANIM